MKRMKLILERLQILRLFAFLYRMKIVKLLIPIAVIAFVYYESQGELRKLNFSRILVDIRTMPPGAIAAILLMSLFAVSVMSAYDFLIRKHFRLNVTKRAAFRYGWISNTFNNFLGFAGFTGAGVRALLYKNSGVTLAQITPAIVFLSPAMVTGLSVLSWAGIVGLLPIGPMLGEHRWLIYAVWGMALYLPVFLLMQRSKLFAKWFHKEGQGSRLPWSVIGTSVLASLLEWFFAGLTFWLICSYFLHGVPIDRALAIYSVSAVAGIVSLAPGGIGAFDITALLGLQLSGVQPEAALAALVLFRVFYFIIPWLIALVLAAFEVAPKRRAAGNAAAAEAAPAAEALQTPEAASAGAEGGKAKKAGEERIREDRRESDGLLNTWQRFWNWPGQFGFLSDMGVWALGKLVLACGLILLLSAATPGLLERLHFMSRFLSTPLMKLSQQISVVIGFLLIILSMGISLRLRRAHRLTSLLLVAGAVFTFVKAFDYEEAIVLLFVALLLWVSRARFNRSGATLPGKRILLWFGFTLLVAFSYYLIGSSVRPGFLYHLPRGIRPEWALRPREYAASAVGGIAGAWILFSILVLLRPKREKTSPPCGEEVQKLDGFLAREKGNLLTHMLYLGDKQLYWAQGGQVLIPYSRSRDKLIVLGDPLGPKKKIGEAIEEFQAFADRYALSVSFYQVSPEYLSVYHERGYRFFKLGEEALINLETFTLSGKKMTAFRTAKNRFERDGYTFTVQSPPYNEELLAELRGISDIWLGDRKEKGFSLGWFNERYLQRSQIALLKDPEGRTIAFATLAPAYDERTVSVDLMRYLPDTPNGTMDLLFARLIEWAKENGYGTFNLGMAPLSSVGKSRSSLREEKLANLVFRYGGHFYGFAGLRRYKEKFYPEWEPRYLAYPSSVSLPLLLIDLVVLVSKKPKKRGGSGDGTVEIGEPLPLGMTADAQAESQESRSAEHPTGSH
ncbi:bifunctional lysylphosphatidylglycerol flippase/synthetase MprF [Saccharibacillus sp. CPCC 101409]|uniref:bifunctional lysylphosphatidylglycerol flippase/synthetase MprF n=1 Tax=Saccharibacillus sp. CPCC 101409 TaxID=3058041 RepID=UPI002670EAFA|nr:bifunctional lysylphosphatidylglycerol flippase/synthetase MprF [Saccharibacillus sp. CPCC 101409]MDO3410958.1 bifunctional lysylphosphatidylglycerol flippase/synthetase MprF [Saccharibacillus sp. CPCC 101409]